MESIFPLRSNVTFVNWAYLRCWAYRVISGICRACRLHRRCKNIGNFGPRRMADGFVVASASPLEGVLGIYWHRPSREKATGVGGLQTFQELNAHARRNIIIWACVIFFWKNANVIEFFFFFQHVHDRCFFLFSGSNFFKTFFYACNVTYFSRLFIRISPIFPIYLTNWHPLYDCCQLVIVGHFLLLFLNNLM